MFAWFFHRGTEVSEVAQRRTEIRLLLLVRLLVSGRGPEILFLKYPMFRKARAVVSELEYEASGGVVSPRLPAKQRFDRTQKRGQARLPDPELTQPLAGIGLKAFQAARSKLSYLVSGYGRWACPRSEVFSSLSDFGLIRDQAVGVKWYFQSHYQAARWIVAQVEEMIHSV